MRRREDKKMKRCEDEKVFEDGYNRPPLIEEPFAQTLSGKNDRNSMTAKTHSCEQFGFAAKFSKDVVFVEELCLKQYVLQT